MVHTCTPEEFVRTLLAGRRRDESDETYGRGLWRRFLCPTASIWRGYMHSTQTPMCNPHRIGRHPINSYFENLADFGIVE